ncbi:MAG: HD domain-containing protein, partial [Candidatus Korarchaeum sp.]|nr:HD domain-containing protein [Candidatus Korarchaeum sp.]MDW8035163.1 HD domain-containing protein [Candidatus Korarchaeum sp.]
MILELEGEILNYLRTSGKLVEAFKYLKENPKILGLLDMSNIVLVHRLKYNDHGLTHAMMTTRNSLKILDILGPELVVTESWRDFNDSKLIVMVASFLHDIGNAVHREEHELLSVALAKPFVDEILQQYYGDPIKEVKVASMIFEAMICHMGRFQPTSIEAGVVATADGCDMEKERARLPFQLGRHDIHKFSALAVEEVRIGKGEEKPLRITIGMKDPSGTFQIEEILLKKIRGD